MRSRMHRDKLRLARVTATRADADSSKDLYEAAFVQTLGVRAIEHAICSLIMISRGYVGIFMGMLDTKADNQGI